MMEKFTKGPWLFDYSSGSIEGGNYKVVCKVGDDWGHYHNARENAALIAAAPEMYDEIKRDVQWLKRLRDSFVIGSDMFRSCSLRIETKEKLLAKARGEDDN